MTFDAVILWAELRVHLLYFLFYLLIDLVLLNPDPKNKFYFGSVACFNLIFSSALKYFLNDETAFCLKLNKIVTDFFVEVQTSLISCNS